jgi:peroxiredoxin
MNQALTVITLAFTIVVSTAIAQKNLTMSPQKPKAGQTISFAYTPTGNLAKPTAVIEAVVYVYQDGNRKADDISLTKNGNAYTFTLKTQTKDDFIQLGFYSGSEFNNNFNEGYAVQLFEKDKPKKGSFRDLGLYYQTYSEETGVEQNESRTLVAMEKEFELYPEQKHKWHKPYFRLLRKVKPEEFQPKLEASIQSALKPGPKTEAEFTYVIELYETGKQTDQANQLKTVRKEKFPTGRWTVDEQIQQFLAEQDVSKKEEMFREISKRIKSDKAWSHLDQKDIDFYRVRLARLYATKEMWDKFRTETTNLSDKGITAAEYNRVAWELQGTNTNLDVAEEFAKFASEYTHSEIQKPTVSKPEHLTERLWMKHRESMYYNYADTWGMVKYRRGEYQAGYELAKDAAITFHKGQDGEFNKTYVLLAEKVLTSQELKPQLEKMIRDGYGSTEATEALKRIYVAENKSDAGLDAYVAALGKEMMEKKTAEVKKTIISKPAPAFTLVDAAGKKVTLADYKGKVIVLDFWATWCGPCISSFPGMQKVVDQYRDNPNVKILFVNTWERADDKVKKATDFLAAKKYRFEVLFDKDNSVAEQFTVDGIPTKFVIDQAGNIRFQSIGYGGSEAGLVSEVAAMVETLTTGSTN